MTRSGLGEDGPTHQPVEHYAALRAIPNLWFVRPGDANEAAAAWALAVERGDGPTALALTRQKLPTFAATAALARDGVRRGGYVLRAASSEAAGGVPDLVLIATGSELQLAMGAADALEADGIATRVVSLPCWEAFEAQDAAYREAVLPAAVRKRVSVEIGVSLGWERWVGDEGAIIGLDHFGASAPAATIFERFGFTIERVAAVGTVRGAGRAARPRPNPGALAGCGSAGLMRVALAADHGGVELRDELLRRLADTGHQLIDLGGDGADPTDDYPDFARRLAHAVRDGEADRGILVCGSGIGASVAASKVSGVRAAVAHDTYSARQGVEHDDLNVLCLGGRVIGVEPAVECARAFLAASFSGAERHARRLAKVIAIETEESGTG